MWNLFLSGRHGQVSTINSPLVVLEKRTQSHFGFFLFFFSSTGRNWESSTDCRFNWKKKITSKGEIRELAHSSRSFERGTRNRRVGNENCSRRTGSSSRVDRGSLYGARGFVCVCVGGFLLPDSNLLLSPSLFFPFKKIVYIHNIYGVVVRLPGHLAAADWIKWNFFFEIQFQ